jgi:hypothetical protein
VSLGEERSRPRAGRPVLILLALIALVAILAAMLWVLAQEPAPLQVRRLPDGIEIRLEAVTFGTEHQFVRGRRWQRLLTPLLPDGLRERIGGKVHSWRSWPGERLVFWTFRRTSPIVVTGAPPGVETRAHLPVVTDEHGCQFEAHTVHAWHNMDKHELIEAHTATAFPRRGERVGLRVGPPTAAGAIEHAEFRVLNPARGHYAAWKAEPLPITRRDGDLAFTLTALTTGSEGPGPTLRPAPRGKLAWSRATFQITEAGRPTDGWSVVGLTLSDATGNRVEPDASSQYAHEGQAHYAMQGGLCVEEPAWKLRAEFARMKDHEPGDLWVVRDVPITRRGSLGGTVSKFTRHGVTLQFLGITAKGAKAPPGGAGWGNGVTVHVQAPSLLKEVRLGLVRAMDDRGRVVPNMGSGSSGSGLYGFVLQAAPDARTLDLTLVLQRSRFAEFVAKPSRLPAVNNR